MTTTTANLTLRTTAARSSTSRRTMSSRIMATAVSSDAAFTTRRVALFNFNVAAAAAAATGVAPSASAFGLAEPPPPYGPATQALAASMMAAMDDGSESAVAAFKAEGKAWDKAYHGNHKGNEQSYKAMEKAYTDLQAQATYLGGFSKDKFTDEKRTMVEGLIEKSLSFIA